MNIQYKPIDLLNKISQNNYSYTGSYTKKITEKNADAEKLQDKAGSFGKKVKALRRYTSGGISRDLLETQVEDLVKSYNDMKSSSDKVTDKDVQKQISKLEKLFSENEKSLKKIGIEKVNDKYTFDNKTFAEVSDKYIDAVLVGHDSFIGQADKIMRKVEETVDEAQYNVAEHKLSRTLEYQEADLELAAYMTLAGNTTSAIKSSNSVVQSGSISNDESQEAMKKLLDYFAKSVYHADNTTDNEDLKKLNQLCLDHEETLAKVGLTFVNDQKNMVFNAGTDVTTDEFKTAYNELFGPNAWFGNTVLEYCKDTFNGIIQPDKLGVSVLDEYA